jgi:Domain of unknown function (DUF4386)
MTRRTNARVAGFTFLLYIAAGITSLVLSGRPQATDVLSLITSLSALVLGVTLYAITREQDRDLALIALGCRIIEAIPGHAGAFFFAVGSTLFSWLLLKGRMIPSALAWLGVIGSAFLVVVLLLQRANVFGGATSWYSGATWVIWFPLLVFEIALGLWLIVKGVATPRTA